MRAYVTRMALGLGIAVLAGACGGDDDGIETCEELAAIVGECGGELTEADFKANVCDTFVLSKDCLNAAAEADCAEHDADDPSYSDVCFPSCEGTESECLDGDTIRVCSQGVELVFFCEAVCEANELAYNGTCDNMFEGMPSASGQDVCWCE